MEKILVILYHRPHFLYQVITIFVLNSSLMRDNVKRIGGVIQKESDSLFGSCLDILLLVQPAMMAAAACV